MVGVNGEEIRFHKPVAYQDVTAGTTGSNIETRRFIDGTLRSGVEEPGGSSIGGL